MATNPDFSLTMSLDSNNMCSIYDSRPSICRVDIMFEKVYFKHYSKEEFYRLNIEAVGLCRKKSR